MPVREKVLTLKYFPIPSAYEVQSITNSTWYHPGDWLSFQTVTKICAMPDWSVVMVSLNLQLPPLPIPLPLPLLAKFGDHPETMNTVIEICDHNSLPETEKLMKIALLGIRQTCADHLQTTTPKELAPPPPETI